MSKKHTFTLIMLRLIEAGRNIRKVNADAADQNALMNSIKCYGLLENLIVQPIVNKDGTYRVVVGHRRFAALKRLERVVQP